MGVHCIVHNVNLAMKTLPCLLTVNIIEGLWYPMFYIYFKKSFKGKWSFQSPLRSWKQKGPIFEKVRWRFIGYLAMMSPTKHIMSKYRILLMKMGINIPNNEKVKHENKIWHVLWCLHHVKTYCHTSFVVISSQFN
jgi:hypothetical protein